MEATDVNPETVSPQPMTRLTTRRYSAPLVAAAAILLFLLTIALEQNLVDRDGRESQRPSLTVQTQPVRGPR